MIICTYLINPFVTRADYSRYPQDDVCTSPDYSASNSTVLVQSLNSIDPYWINLTTSTFSIYIIYFCRRDMLFLFPLLQCTHFFWFYAAISCSFRPAERTAVMKGLTFL